MKLLKRIKSDNGKRSKEMFRYRHSTMKDSIHTRGCLNRVNNDDARIPKCVNASGGVDGLLVPDHSGRISPTGDVVGQERSEPIKASDLEADEAAAEAEAEAAAAEAEAMREEEELRAQAEALAAEGEGGASLFGFSGLELEPDPEVTPWTEITHKEDRLSIQNCEQEEKKEDEEEVAPDSFCEMGRPSLDRPSSSALYKMGCSRRLSCPKIESRRSITFGTVTIRDYEMTLGNHPDCSYGPPVQLGWNYLEYCPLELNEYEMHHSLRRPLKDLVLNYYQRRDLLRGFDEQTLKAAVKEVKRTQMKRSVTRATLPVRRVEDVAESARRKMGRILMKRRDEDELGAWCKGDDSVATASTADTALEVEGNPISVQ